MATMVLSGKPAPLPIAAIVFDAYGTLLDVHSALARVTAAGGTGLTAERARSLSLLWRDKQLAYTWLRNSMRVHADFAAVTADALDHALESHGLTGDEALRTALLDAYRRLDPYPEVPDALAALKAAGWPLAVLSNGTPDMLATGLESAGIARHLDAVLSVEAIGLFKPVPEAYALATRHFGVPAPRILFLSANGWDVHGASTFGCTAIHVDRATPGGQRAAAERLPGGPAHTVASLGELPALARSG
jgi:2-haloacid dehalogenase